MKKYVALLRGINVGGNNTIKMDDLKVSFTSAGFVNVLTYINSGNVIFDTDFSREDEIISAIEELIKKDFALDIPVVVRDIDNIQKICDTVPSAWRNDKDHKTDVMFLWDEYADKRVLDKLPIKKGVDVVRYIDRACVWHLDKSAHTQSGIGDIVGTKLYKKMTVRNINTVRKLGELMGE